MDITIFWVCDPVRILCVAVCAAVFLIASLCILISSIVDHHRNKRREMSPRSPP